MSQNPFPAALVDQIASDVHDSWMDRKRAAGCQGAAISRHTGANLMVAYDGLTDPDKEDDRVTVRTVLRSLDEAGLLSTSPLDEQGRPVLTVRHLLDPTSRIWTRLGQADQWTALDVVGVWPYGAIERRYGRVTLLVPTIPTKGTQR